MRTKALTGLLFVSVLTVISSCGKVEDSDLKLDFPAGTAFLLPQGKVSCFQSATLPNDGTPTNDISANSMSYNKITLAWANTTDTVSVKSIQIEFRHSNIASGTYSCLIAGDEINAIFRDPAAVGGVLWDGDIIPGAAVKTSSCSLGCGGMKVVDKNVPFQITGTAKAMGIQTDPDGNEKVVTGTAQLKLIFQGGFN
jgi:hypothetical protein